MGNLNIDLTVGETSTITVWQELDAAGNPMDPVDASYGAVTCDSSEPGIASVASQPAGAFLITALAPGVAVITGSATSPTAPNPTITGTATVTVTGPVAASLIPQI